MSDRPERGPYLQQYDNPYSELGPIEPPHDRIIPNGGDFPEPFHEEGEGHRSKTEEEDTQNALNQLFPPVPGAAEHGGEEGEGMQLDPTLASEIEAQHQRHSRAAEQGQGGSASASATATPPPGAGAAGPVKRKATSRADMLARGGACDFCKRRKLKCSAELPACLVCRRAGHECVYSQKKQRSKVKMLEERLLELERKLDGGQPQTQAQSLQGASAPAPALDPDLPGSVDASTTILETPSYHYGVPHIDSTFHLPDYEVDPNLDGETGQDLAQAGKEDDHQPEPDLMTLADAAAGRDWPWDGMTSEGIAKAILASVTAQDVGRGGTVGDKVVAHLITVYRNAGYIFFLSDLIPVNSLAIRLLRPTASTNGDTTRPHPALLLSVITWLLPYSPSPALASPAIYAILQPQAQLQSMQAMSNPDGRLLDVIVGDAARAMNCYRQARFLEGWGEGARVAALVCAAGLSKLGGVLPSDTTTGVEGERGRKPEVMEREKRIRSLIHKGQVVEPAKTPAELGYRIDVFWNVFLQDQCAAIGWGWPFNFSIEEITTPFPKDDYEHPDAFLDTYTLSDFFDPHSTKPVSAIPDNDCALFIKSQAICYRACRAFDSNSPMPTADLLTIAKRHESAMRPIPANPTSAAEIAIQHAMLSQAWMALHTGMAYIYARQALDHSSTATATVKVDDDLPQAECVAALSKVVDYLHMSYEGGDMELEGMTICAQTIWFAAASLAYRIHRRLAALPKGKGKGDKHKGVMDESKRIGDELTRACHITGKKEKYGATTAQLLENIALGLDVKLGEWVRPDNIA